MPQGKMATSTIKREVSIVHHHSLADNLAYNSTVSLSDYISSSTKAILITLRKYGYLDSKFIPTEAIRRGLTDHGVIFSKPNGVEDVTITIDYYGTLTITTNVGTAVDLDVTVFS